METAPFYEEIAEGPADGRAVWVHASDGVRLRVGYWPGGPKGTVLLFPGRTEYIEKYGPAAAELHSLGYSTLTIDWRGQGLSDRQADDPMLGHVDDFQEYQLDVAALLKVADALNCPTPHYLIAHSMGCAIALRALHEGLNVSAAAFTGPMWGIEMSPLVRAVSGPMTRFLSSIGRGMAYAPTTKGETYVLSAPFQDNMLTTDPEMYTFRQKQASAHPKLTLAGPSLIWLGAALRETEALEARGAASVPALTQLGTQERIVDPEPIHQIMEKWQNGKLEIVPNCEHEIMMETPDIRSRFFAAADKLFTENSD